MVIAAFIAMLYSFTLSFRADIAEVEISPRAESTIDKIVLQHRALQSFAAGNVSYSTGTRVVSFTPGEVTFSRLKDYLPYGFNKGSEEADYVSAIYCMDPNSPGFSQPKDCNTPGATAYLITYGCIDARWKSLTSGKPNNDLVTAIKKIVRAGTMFGYTAQADVSDPRNDLKSPMALQGNLNTWVAIPQYIVNNDNGIADGRSFSQMCTGNNSDCEYWLAYMTPTY